MPYEEYIPYIVGGIIGLVAGILSTYFSEVFKNCFERKKKRNELLDEIYNHINWVIENIYSEESPTTNTERMKNVSGRFTWKELLSKELYNKLIWFDDEFVQHVTTRHEYFLHIFKIVEEHIDIIQNNIRDKFDLGRGKMNHPRSITIRISRKIPRQYTSNDIVLSLFQRINPIDEFEKNFGLTDTVDACASFGRMDIIGEPTQEEMKIKGKESMDIFTNIYNEYMELLKKDKTLMKFWSDREQLLNDCKKLMAMIEKIRE